MSRHPAASLREQRAMTRARTGRRRHRADDGDLQDGRHTEEYIEPYRSRRTVCIALVDTEHGWKKLGQFPTHGQAIDVAVDNARHCVVRDLATWKVIYDNNKR